MTIGNYKQNILNCLKINKYIVKVPGINLNMNHKCCN